MKTIKRSYIREILDSVNDKTISFAGGLPNEDLFPIEELRDATLKAFEYSSSLQYSKSKGLDELRSKIAYIYTKYLDFPTSKDEILITTGSQQAFDIISKSNIINEIFVQTPTYIGALSSFKISDLKVESFKDIDCLNDSLKEKSALYIMSDFSNPTGKSFDDTQRKEIANILNKDDFTINKKTPLLIEDAAYSLLDFEGKIYKPISSRYKNSFHLGSFSKIIAPGLRIGWIRAEENLLEKVLVAKESLDLHTSTLNQMILNEYLEKNDLFKHISILRNEYKNKMEFMSSCFKKFIPSFTHEKPKGGMFIYGKFKEDSFILAKRCLEKNIAFVPATVFFHDNKDSFEARFNFTNSSNEEIEKGIIEISKLLNNSN